MWHSVVRLAGGALGSEASGGVVLGSEASGSVAFGSEASGSVALGSEASGAWHSVVRLAGVWHSVVRLAGVWHSQGLAPSANSNMRIVSRLMLFISLCAAIWMQPARALEALNTQVAGRGEGRGGGMGAGTICMLCIV